MTPLARPAHPVQGLILVHLREREAAAAAWVAKEVTAEAAVVPPAKGPERKTAGGAPPSAVIRLPEGGSYRPFRDWHRGRGQVLTLLPSLEKGHPIAIIEAVHEREVRRAVEATLPVVIGAPQQGADLGVL